MKSNRKQQQHLCSCCTGKKRIHGSAHLLNLLTRWHLRRQGLWDLGHVRSPQSCRLRTGKTRQLQTTVATVVTLVVWQKLLFGPLKAKKSRVKATWANWCRLRFKFAVATSICASLWSSAIRSSWLSQADTSYRIRGNGRTVLLYVIKVLLVNND